MFIFNSFEINFAYSNQSSYCCFGKSIEIEFQNGFEFKKFEQQTPRGINKVIKIKSLMHEDEEYHHHHHSNRPKWNGNAQQRVHIVHEIQNVYINDWWL